MCARPRCRSASFELARGRPAACRVPARNALLADVVPPAAYGRAYGSDAMDNLGAIFGPLLAIVLVGVVGTRWAIVLSVLPGLAAALAIVYAIRHTASPHDRDREPSRLRVRPVFQGRLGRLMIGVTAFELGNCAATLLILRATEIFSPGRTEDRATQLALLLYILYNVAAAAVSVPAGRHGDRHSPVGPSEVLALAPAFVLTGIGIGCAETAQHAAVAILAPNRIRGSAFGILAAIQAGGNLAASTIAGILWTAASPRTAFVFLGVMMITAVPIIAVATARSSPHAA